MAYDRDGIVVKGDDGVNSQDDGEYGTPIAAIDDDGTKRLAVDSKVMDVANTALYGQLTVGTTPVELKVGGSALAARKAVTMQGDDNQVYWGYDNSVTTSTGTRLYKGQFYLLPMGEDITVYLVGDIAGRSVRIGELA